LLVDRPLRIAGFFRTIYFIPVVIGFCAASTLWMWLLNPDSGVFAQLLRGAGIIDSAPRPLESFWPALGVVILKAGQEDDNREARCFPDDHQD
ncbi:hypothetical protein ACC695_38550, partial [Rhizobium ruizarguesonis]